MTLVNIKSSISLREYNSFKIDVIAKYFIRIETVEQLQSLSKNPIFIENKRYFLWAWSNTFFTKDFDGIIVHIDIQWINIIKETNNSTTLRVWAGQNWDEFVNLCTYNRHLYGIENLVSIPGQVWACPVQNIWAYGVEAKDTIESVEYLDMNTWHIQTLTNKQCEFWYRDSVFKQSLYGIACITHVSFTLCKKDAYTVNNQYGAITQETDSTDPKDICSAIKKIRASKLPDRHKIGTAWSFFKNPLIDEEQFLWLQKKYPDIVGHPHHNHIKVSAWRLIEQTVGKNYRIWDAATYEKHALVLVNLGNASPQDMLMLIEHIQTQVEQTFWVHLEPEVNIL